MHRKKLPLLALLVTLAAACGGDGGSPTAPTPTTGSPLSWGGLRDFIEALFLSDGPLSVGPPSGFMGGFPVGSQITVLFLNTVDPSLLELWREAIQDLTGGCAEQASRSDFDRDIPCAMGLTFTYSETSDRARMEDALQGGPRPPTNEVWVYGTDGACTGGDDSFTHKYYEAGSRVTSAAIICLGSLGGLPANDYDAAQEMGHALGFHDLRFLDMSSYMMVPDSHYCALERVEFAAVETVYAAGLRPGDSRQDFINAGLIDP